MKGALWTGSGRFRQEGGTCQGGRRGRGRERGGGGMGRAAGAVQPLQQPGICLLGFPITDPRGPGKEGGGGFKGKER
jgi:hypothetical protein